MPYFSPLLRLLRRLTTRREGSVAMLFGLMAIPLIIAAGLAIDVTRAYSVRVRLNNALDAAALAVGASPTLTSAQLQSRLQAYFTANYPASALGVPTTPTMTASTNGNVITVQATAQLNTTFMQIIGVKQLTVAAESQVTKGSAGLELALALDNTGSMLSSNNIQAVRDDAVELVNTLFSTTTDTNRLRISVVPFVTAVNVGATLAQQPGLLQTPPSIVYDTSQSDDTKWKGCVMEPQYPADISESTSTWPAAYLWDNRNDNVLTRPDGSSNQHITHVHGSLDDCNFSAAQNNSCPTPITPLTSDQTVLTDALNSMQAWCLSGTMIQVGLAWGWRTISPNSVFENANFPIQPLKYNTTGWHKALVLMTDGQNQVFQGCDETFVYDSNSTSKTSDPARGGASPFFGTSGSLQTKGQNPGCLRANTHQPALNPPPGSGMTPYGRLGDPGSYIGKGVTDPSTGTVVTTGATSISQGQRLMDEETAEACTAMKNAGVTVYTIAFTGSATASINMLKTCATDAAHFYDATSGQAALKTAFEQIAQSLDQLRISQ